MRRLNAVGDWLALRSTRFQGTWAFLGLHLVWWLVWWLLHLSVDLLTLWVSLEAIVQTSLVAMGQRLLTEHVTSTAAAVEAPKNVATVATCRHCRDQDT